MSLDVDFDIIEGQSGEINVTLSAVPSGGLEIDVQVDLLTTLLTAEGLDDTLAMYCIFTDYIYYFSRWRFHIISRQPVSSIYCRD